jgi:class 3 adenylate cyclase
MTQVTKQLAVLFADVCGSSVLYCTLGDERAQITVNSALQIVSAVLPEFGGQMVKTIGDEVMCIFADPNQAVQAACAMQSRIDAAQPGGQRISMHMGVHFGPVLVEAGDVFGDTVNAASHLCAVASPGEILISDQTASALSGATRKRASPLFFAILKGNTAESTVYRIPWQSGTSMLTDVNFGRHNLIPPDIGSLLVMLDSTQLRIDLRRPIVTLGRDIACDLTVVDSFVSRRHATLTLRHTQVFLTDQSTNGTFVRRSDGATAHVFRTELLLDGEGEISLGRAFEQETVQTIRFKRDRRALYRV